MRHFLIILLACILAACSKTGPGMKGPDPCQTEPIEVPISSAELQEARFKTGTYWVYIDSINFTKDSNAVIKHSSSFYTPEGSCESKEAHSYELYKYGSNSGNVERYDVTTSSIIQNSEGYNQGIMFYNISGQNGSPLYSTTRHDSLFVYDRYYKNVWMTTVFNDKIEGYTKANYYFNTAYGVLRKDLFNSNGQLIKKRLLMRKQIVK